MKKILLIFISLFLVICLTSCDWPLNNCDFYMDLRLRELGDEDISFDEVSYNNDSVTVKVTFKNTSGEKRVFHFTKGKGYNLTSGKKYKDKVIGDKKVILENNQSISFYVSSTIPKKVVIK